MNQSSQMGYDAEIVALDILKKNKFETIFSEEKLKRDRSINKGATLHDRVEEQHKLERMGWGTYLRNPIVKRPSGGGIYDIKCAERYIEYRKKEIPTWLKKIPVSSPNELKALKEKFWNREYRNRELCEYEKECQKMMLKIIGKSIVPRSTKKHLKERIEREKDPYWKIFWKKTQEVNNTFVDIFCKKNRKYYIVDVKFKSDKTLYEKNRFDITDFEALNYPTIVKKKKVGLIILVVVGDGKNYRYTFKEWSDFLISPNYRPHERKKTKVKMEVLTPFEKLHKITVSKDLYDKYLNGFILYR